MSKRITQARLAVLSTFALSVFVMTGTAHAYQPQSEAAAKPATRTATTLQGGQNKALQAVDINSASKAELKTLTGVDDALAARIIAGRPYLSKANLVTHNIMPAGLYMSLKQRIIAKQK